MRLRLTAWPRRTLVLAIVAGCLGRPSSVDAGKGRQPALPRAYVTDSELDVVSVIDTTTNAVIATVPVGSGLRPLGIAISPDGTTAYVTNPGSDTVSAIDLASEAVTTIFLPDCAANGCGPSAVVVSVDGTLLYVVNMSFNAMSVLRIDVATHRVSPAILLDTGGYSGSWADLALTPDGSKLYVVGPNVLAIIDAANWSLIANRSGSHYDVVVAGDGSAAYAARSDGLSVIDTATDEIHEIHLEGEGGLTAASPTDQRIYAVTSSGISVLDANSVTVLEVIPFAPSESFLDLAITPDGRRLLFLGYESLAAFDLQARRFVTRIPLGQIPAHVSLTPDGRFAYLTNRRFQVSPYTMSVVDLTEATVRDLFPESPPGTVVVAPSGSLALVAKQRSGEIVAIDTATNQVTKTVRADGVRDVAFDSTGKRAYVSASLSGSPTPTGAIRTLDVDTLAFDSSIVVDGTPGPLLASPNGDTLYATLQTPDLSILVIDTATGSVRKTLSLGDACVGRPPSSCLESDVTEIAITPDEGVFFAGIRQYFFNEVFGRMAVVDLASDRVVGYVGDGSIEGIAVSPDGQRAYATSWYYLLGDERSEVLVVDTATAAVTATVPVKGGAAAVSSDGRFLYLTGREIQVLDTRSLSIAATIRTGIAPSDIAIGNVPSRSELHGHAGGCRIEPSASRAGAAPLLLLATLVGLVVLRLKRSVSSESRP